MFNVIIILWVIVVSPVLLVTAVIVGFFFLMHVAFEKNHNSLPKDQKRPL